MKAMLSNLISKITYSDSSNEEIVKSVVQNTKNNKELTLVKSDKPLKCSDKAVEGILRRKSK